MPHASSAKKQLNRQGIFHIRAASTEVHLN